MAGALELYLFDSGALALGSVEVPVAFFLLHDPQGLIVVDGGNPLAVARDPHALGRLAGVFEVHMSEAHRCETQLREIGVDPDDVSHIIQTHLHIDHTGALGPFPNAMIRCGAGTPARTTTDPSPTRTCDFADEVAALRVQPGEYVDR